MENTITDTASTTENTATRSVPAPPTYSSDASTWLKTLPNSLDRTDLYALNDGDFAVKCVRELLEKPRFELPVEATHPASLWFSHFFFESRNREKVFGTRNLGVGYPMVLARVGGYDLSAPLFIWQIQLEPHAQHPDEWNVQRTEAQRILPNYPLFHLIDTLRGTDFTKRARQLADSGAIGTHALAELADGVRMQLSLTEEGLALAVQPCPTKDELERTQAEGQLRWSAVAGIFPSLPRTTVTEAPAVAPDQPNGLEWQHGLTLLPLDPSQRMVLQTVQKNTLTVVEGASGTGKTYLISALAINALSNGKKCLVVSKSISALRRAQKFLLEKGFGTCRLCCATPRATS
ncbi:MAG: PhoH family protein [Lewinellaceae bacterium]|nr:PhoH family protein [Lewinellaceae bacterium]